MKFMSTPLPPTFAFSQSSLQAYEDCPRRFWLAYVEQLPWPAVEASPVQEHEALLRLGERFHRLIQRTEIGIDPTVVAAGLEPPLSTWFDAYLRHRPADLPQAFIEIERVLSATLAVQDEAPADVAAPRAEAQPLSWRLAAKYDLIAAEPGGRVIIVDWKTAKRRPDPAALRLRWQSIVYPFVLVEASVALPWGPVRPEQVEMRYWFTAAPAQPIVLRYDAAQHEANRRRLERTLAQILAGRAEADFPKVADTPINRKRFCAFCVYRSRCNRGEKAGDLEELDDPETFFAVDLDKALEFTLADVEELAF
ncbi:PD-(D/E)XK nuclease family protein [Caldilinea sp.]|uniref:PD-(D/E)XK nuclease family protein n=2 Tax=Caldilinea sp. TaxID=2293560 RepID=UPI00263046EA|nr:PD-(D/E)XK nuclease family protein [uncultured Caldilinea sp.]